MLICHVLLYLPSAGPLLRVLGWLLRCWDVVLQEDQDADFSLCDTQRPLSSCVRLSAGRHSARRQLCTTCSGRARRANRAHGFVGLLEAGLSHVVATRQWI